MAYGIVVFFCLLLQKGAEGVLKTCYHETLQECPRFSLCSRSNSSESFDLKCICLQHFQHNPKWQDIVRDDENATLSSVEEEYCIPSPSLNEKTEDNQIILYIQSSANPQHLVLAIILILLAVTLVTAFLYGLKALRPIKRTTAVYKRLTNRRQNIIPLQEMDELDLNRRYEMETYAIKM